MNVDVTTTNPHGFKIGSTTSLTITGSNPDYDGTYLMLAVGPSDLQFPYTSDLGQGVTGGSLSYLISVTKGYFNSTLVYRNSQFEVSP